MKQERKEAVLAESGKFMIDIAKLVFGGVILAGIMKRESINPWLLIGMGGIAVTFCLLTGLVFTAMSKSKED